MTLWNSAGDAALGGCGDPGIPQNAAKRAELLQPEPEGAPERSLNYGIAVFSLIAPRAELGAPLVPPCASQDEISSPVLVEMGKLFQILISLEQSQDWYYNYSSS